MIQYIVLTLYITMGMASQKLHKNVRPESQEFSGQWRTLNLGFVTGNPEIAGKIQILWQVFRKETQILIIISSPVQCILKHVK